MTEILPVPADPSVPDRRQVGGLLRERIGMRVLRQMWAALRTRTKLPRDHGRLAALKGLLSRPAARCRR
ncbi:hypothetical protein ACLQ2P_11520 [Actinomadura citrea]|uniref:hypothetical protein n=1 Tax=Actinomadura citrea TaxID=46158 RepID=UPI003CE4A3A6